MKLERGMTITGAMLREAGACEEECAKVDRLFPGGAPLTLNNLLTAAMEGLDVGWMGSNLLPAPARVAYREARNQAGAAHHKVVATAWAAYAEAVARAEAAYAEAAQAGADDEAVDQAGAAYHKAVDRARVAYREAVDQARVACAEAKARALWSVLGDDEEA